jgi:hypothetical protein
MAIGVLGEELLTPTLDKGPRSRVQWNWAFLLVKSFKLVWGGVWFAPPIYGLEITSMLELVKYHQTLFETYSPLLMCRWRWGYKLRAQFVSSWAFRFFSCLFVCFLWLWTCMYLDFFLFNMFCMLIIILNVLVVCMIYYSHLIVLVVYITCTLF